MNGLDQLLGGWLRSAAEAALGAMGQGLLGASDPDLAAAVPSYDHMLAVALPLMVVFAALAVAERVLGGEQGRGAWVTARVVAALLFAYSGLAIVVRVSGVFSLLADAWGAQLARSLADPLVSLLSDSAMLPATIAPLTALASLLLLLLSVVVYLELLVRSALLIVAAVFIPLVCAFAVWPRFARLATHLSEFLVSLLLAKLVIVVSLAVGAQMLAASGGADPVHRVMLGAAVLIVAALSPLLLLQAVRIAETGSSGAVRGLVASAGKVVVLAGSGLAGGPAALGAVGAVTGSGGTALVGRLVARQRPGAGQ